MIAAGYTSAIVAFATATSWFFYPLAREGIKNRAALPFELPVPRRVSFVKPRTRSVSADQNAGPRGLFRSRVVAGFGTSVESRPPDVTHPATFSYPNCAAGAD